MAKRSTTTRGLTVSPSNEHDPGAKKKKDDKPEELLSKTALDFCGKCKKKCKGKYNPQKSKPRPILVKLQRAIDASSILANKGSLSAPISIQPDKSPAELQIESILLKERWNLIQAGHQRKALPEISGHGYVLS